MKIDVFIEFVEKVLLWVGCSILTFIMLLTSTDAILRYVFRTTIPGAYEIVAEYLMPYLVYLTMGYVFAKGGHIRVTMLTDHLPDILNKIIMIIFNGMAVILFLLIGYGGLKRTINAASLNEFSSSILSYPLAPAYFSVVIGSLLISVRLVQAIVSRKHPDSSIIDE